MLAGDNHPPIAELADPLVHGFVHLGREIQGGHTRQYRRRRVANFSVAPYHPDGNLPLKSAKQVFSRRVATTSAAQTGAPYRATEPTTAAYTRRTLPPGPPRFGSSRLNAMATPSTLGARRRKCSPKDQVESRWSPKYLILSPTWTRASPTRMNVGGGGPCDPS